MVLRLARLGEVEGALAASHGRRGTGLAWSTSYVYVGRVFSAGAAWRTADAEYATLSDLSAPLRARLAVDAGATVSTRLGSRASATTTWQRQRYHGMEPTRNTVSLTTTYRVAARSELYTTLSRGHVGGAVNASLYVGLTTGVGRRGTIGASVEHTSGGTVAAADAQQSLPVAEGYGYRVRAAGGEAGSIEADLQYQSRFGRYEVRQSSLDGRSATALWASGAVVAIGGRAFATRPVEQSFALVRVPGVPRVRTFVSNQEVGRTDRRGDLLVPNLLPYYGNLLSIADEDIPLELTIGRRDLTLAPPSGGGALALFPVSREYRATGRVQVLEHGNTVMPAYGRITVEVGGKEIGSAGEFYLEGLVPGSHPATVDYKDGACAFTLVVPGEAATVVQLGLVRCLAD
jgi:outer membrane usher protein